MLWQQCLQQLESQISDNNINTWLRPLHANEHEDTLYLLAPNPLVLQEVHEQYIPMIIQQARSLSGNDTYQVMLQIGSGSLPSSNNDNEENSKKINGHSSSSDHAHGSSSPGEPAIISRRYTNNLSNRLTFDNFVEGKSNQLARAASMQVSENPGSSYNPLFIYGGTGLGKTHLMHAIGNSIREANPSATVVYLHSERFVSDMVAALRNNRIEEFKQYYRSVDALLIDDIQFFAGKGRSMEEFFHTFNALLEGQKQIVLASDRYPRDVEGIDDRLRSRLNWGLTVPIESPDLETRVAILRKKGEEFGQEIPNDVAFFIAQRFRSNIRDLEGALQRVIATIRLRNHTDISLDFVREALRDQLASQAKMVTLDNIKKTVASYYNIRVSDLDSKKRSRSIARPRQVAMSLAKELTNHSLPEIGQDFGGRDHTTILHGCRKIKELRISDTKLDEDYRILRRTLSS
jgi:chromosomal replication initiator protein